MACAAPLRTSSELPSGVPPYVLRLASSSDEALIFSSWLRGQREVLPWSLEPARAFYERERGRLEARIARGTTWVMCHAGDASEVIGWACVGASAEGVVVHWIYVSKLWRRRGVGRLLAAAVGVREGTEVRTTGWGKGCVPRVEDGRLRPGWMLERFRVVWLGGA